MPHDVSLADRYDLTKKQVLPAVLCPATRSRADCINIIRTKAWVPFNKTWCLFKSYLSASETSCCMVRGLPICAKQLLGQKL